MWELILIYKWAILAGMAMAPALALIGGQLAARDQAMQTLCVGQGATLGVLLGLGILKMAEAGTSAEAIGPFFTAGIFSVLTYLATERTIRKRQASKNTVYSSVFAVLLALGYLVCAVFPPLENHMSQVFFGDLATLSNGEAGVTVFLGGLALLLFTKSWRLITRQSFHHAVFGREPSAMEGVFPWLLVAALSFCVQYLGFLYTMACLFLPTTIASRIRGRGIRFHFVFSSLLGALSALVGFLLSLRYSQLPTVPLIVIAMVVFGTLALVTMGHAVRPLQE